MSSSNSGVHPTAIVEDGVSLGRSVRVWHFAHVRAGACLGDGVSIGKSAYIDAGVRIGTGSRIQNDVNVFAGVNIGDWCFIGPAVVFTNDISPRVGNRDWELIETYIHHGASVGAGAVVRCGIEIGAFSMVGAGAVVTRSVPAFHLATGVPARAAMRICACGKTTLPLETGGPPIQSCCEQRMQREVFDLAAELLAR